MTHLKVALQNVWIIKERRQRQYCCSKGFTCHRTLMQDNKKMQYSCRLLCRNAKYTNRKIHRIKKRFAQSFAFGHMFSSTSNLISSLARHRGKNLLACLIPLAVFSCDVLACSIHCIQERHLVLWTMVKILPSPG